MVALYMVISGYKEFKESRLLGLLSFMSLTVLLCEFILYCLVFQL